MARRYEFYVNVREELYLTSEHREQVRYCCCHKNIKFISSSQSVMFLLLYKHADDSVSDRSSEDFRPLSEDFRIFSKIVAKAEHFPNISKHLPKIAEDDRRRFDDVSIIHQQI